MWNDKEGENGGYGGKLEFHHKKQIILSYMDADISESIPDRPAYVPGIGRTPTLKGLADDTFRIIRIRWGTNLGDAMIEQMEKILSVNTPFGLININA